MPSNSAQRFQDSALSRESRPWGREVEQRLQALEQASSSGADSALNANKAQNSSIALVSKNIVDLNARVQDAIDDITIVGPQIISGPIPASFLSGTVTNDTVAVNATSDNTFSHSAAGTNITAGRYTVWVRTSDGLLGNTSSSMYAKTLIEDPPEPPDPLKILEFSNRYYQYADELAIRDDPENPEYDPEYHVQQEWGPMAEELHALGLWQVVIYADHERPVSIHHALFGQLAIEAAKYVWQQHLALAAEVEQIKSFIGFTPTSS